MLNAVIPMAAAQPAATGPQGLIAQFFPFIIIFAIMYFLMIRPQQKKAKEHQALLGRLKVGDKVITNGGIHGTISGVQERTVRVEIANKVEMTLNRGAIAQVIETETK